MFLKISEDYFSCLSPIAFNINENQLIVANSDEILARIAKKDKELQEKMSGEGLEDIRNQFLQTVNTAEKLQKFMGITTLCNPKR